MAAFLDVCRFTPSAGGTTDWTYAAAVTGYQSPVAAGVVNGRFYKYRAESSDLSQWEVGEGAYNTGTGVLARTTVLFNSSGTTSKINFSATPQVAIVALKEDLISIEEANSFTTAQKLQVRTNIGTFDEGAWSPFTPSPSAAGVSAWTVNSARYKQWGKVVHWEIDLAITTGTWTAGSTMTFTLPATANSPGSGSGWEFVAIGVGIFFYINPGGLSQMSARCGSNLIATSRFVASGIYEST
ncbi:hypothetical protein [Bradyrhizobium sp. 21]|uniref:hypothetical protein n=1 Tax=Bradyrhizobium sp. 21 TaxID=2782666 RepID=UPI001FFB99FC|nr:hypothetical protein [Bradyrhizobium sp. 21]